MKKYSLVIDEDKIPRICEVIGVYYKLAVEDPLAYTRMNTIQLGSLCFSSHTKKFYYIGAVSIPHKLYKRYHGERPSKEKLDELERLGIYPYNDIEKLVNKWNEYIEKTEAESKIEKYIADKDIEFLSNRHKQLSGINSLLVNGKKLEELVTNPDQKLLIDQNENLIKESPSTSKEKTRVI